jgi:hypothetical protein
MKKVFLIAAFALCGFIGVAQKTDNKEKETIEKPTPNQEGYAEVKPDNLSRKITMAMEKNYPKTNIDNAYWNEKRQKYRLEVSKESGETSTLYIDREGNFVDGQ